MRARIPVAQVEVKINNAWVKMQRANNNQWPYYNTNGPWQTGFPMPIRISSIAGEVGTLSYIMFITVVSPCLGTLHIDCRN